MKLYTLGTSHGAAEAGHACSHNLFEISGRYYLFDCGGSAEYSLMSLGIDPTLLSAVFISHMHEDHVGSLTGIIKRFTSYNPGDRSVSIFMPDERAVGGLQAWLDVLNIYRHDGVRFLTECARFVNYFVTKQGVIFDDGFVKVTALPTRHVVHGLLPSFAFLIEGEGKRVLYTADLDSDFSDYPEIVFKEDFDLILSELVHFDIGRNLSTIQRSRTKHLVFTHYKAPNLAALASLGDAFPFRVTVAEDGQVFEI